MNPYVAKLVGSNCLCDIMPYFSNFCSVEKRDKEISESMACYVELERRIGKEELAKCFVLVIGDGILPRTASIISHFSRAQCMSIDPMMRVGEFLKPYYDFKDAIKRPILRMGCFKGTFEEYLDNHFVKEVSETDFEKLVLVFPHSHAPFTSSVLSVNQRGFAPHVVSMPCCYNIPRQVLENCNHGKYRDENVMSAKRDVYFFRNLDVLSLKLDSINLNKY